MGNKPVSLLQGHTASKWESMDLILEHVFQTATVLTAILGYFKAQPDVLEIG
jgi:hypothetical protein